MKKPALEPGPCTTRRGVRNEGLAAQSGKLGEVDERAPLPRGKLPHAFLAELLGGAELPPEVVVGPRVGEDACAIELPAGTLVCATDPITLTGTGVGSHAVIVNANDVAVMGARPRYFLAAVLLPAGTARADVRALMADLRAALARLGACLVGGHTEVTDVVSQPVVVGQMLGLCETPRPVTTAGARPGHLVVQVGAAPIEGAAVLAGAAGGALRDVAPELLAAARGALESPGISVVDAALLAAGLGAAALHDPTEGGLSAGLYELADASGVELRVTTARLLWFEPGTALCRALGADPFGTLASGTLLAAFPPAGVEAALAAFGSRGLPARVIATARSGSGVRDDAGAPLPRYDRDELSRVLP